MNNLCEAESETEALSETGSAPPTHFAVVTESASFDYELTSLPESAVLHYISNDALQFELRIQYNCQKQMFICTILGEESGKN